MPQSQKERRHAYYIARRGEAAQWQREYRKAHREQVRANARRYYAENKERALEYHNRSVLKHREQILERQAEYRVKHRDEIVAKKRAAYAANPEKYRAMSRAWRERNPEKAREMDRRRRANHIGRHREHTWKAHGFVFTWGEFREMQERQKGCCASCREPCSALHVDHNHTTGAVRELLCPPCNKALGLLDENLERVRNAAIYLERNGIEYNPADDRRDATLDAQLLALLTNPPRGLPSAGETAEEKNRRNRTEISRRYRARHPAKAQERRWRGHGILMTWEEYARRYRQQAGRCVICKNSAGRLAVDHCHNSRRVCGLLCRRCNLEIGRASCRERV